MLPTFISSCFLLLNNSNEYFPRLQEAEASHQVIQQEKFQLESNLKNEIETAKVNIIQDHES